MRHALLSLLMLTGILAAAAAEAPPAVPDTLASTIRLGEVTVRPKKEKYSKRNNPAVDFMRSIAGGGELTDPRRNPWYNYTRYERITLALSQMSDSDAILRHFPEMRQYLDTSEVSGSRILNVSVKEKLADEHWRRNPSSHKAYVTALKRRGIDEVFDQQSIQTLLEDVLREVDVYGNDVNILQNRFVSPLGRLGPDFYKYYLTDTLRTVPATPGAQGADSLVVLSFVPRTSESFGFTGRFYVAAGDTTYFIRRIEMGVPSQINLNFISHLYINQEYDRAPDGSRLKTRDDMTLELSVLGKAFYVRRNTSYYGHNFRELDPGLFSGPEEEVMAGAEAMPDAWWQTARPVRASKGEAALGDLMESLRRNKLYYWGEKVLHALATGYVPTGNPSKVDIGPINTFVSGNSLEGVRLKAGATTTAALSPRWFVRGWGAWGTRDHKWKYLAEVEHSFHDKRVHPREFPVHSIALTSSYDVDMLGQHYQFTNPDNFVLSIKRKADRQMTYHAVNKLTYTLEMHNNLSVRATLQHERQEATAWMPFADGLGRSYSHYQQTGLTVELRYAPGEKFFQARSVRIPVNLDAPVIVLSHTVAPKGLFGAPWCINRTELSLQKRLWFSAFGFADIVLKGGHVWGRAPYPALLIPNANLSYTIQPESFALMNPMEFINDSYGQWDVTYWANGWIFNRIPLLKKLKLREVVNFRGLWGHLSQRNDPDADPRLYRFPADAHVTRMTSTPYMEISAGIDNLLQCLRLDYVWRLTYRDTPGVSHSGLRVALHITF